MNNPNLNPQLAQQLRCTRCGYDLRELRSDCCPECGHALYFKLADFDNEAHFRRTCDQLDDAGVNFRTVEVPGTSNIADFLANRGPSWLSHTILVINSDLARARWILESVEKEKPLPIVDRAEPNCPTCNEPLDSNGAEQCPKCGKEFHWVEIDEADRDFDL